MQMVRLKDFQIETVNRLLDVTTVNEKKEILLQAPTGSGKTIILLSFIEEYLKEDKNIIFIWLTPGKGELEEQSKDKMIKFLPNLEPKGIQEVLLQGFNTKDVAFINWETITKKGNTALKDAERKNLYERIREARNVNSKFIVIIDEEHVNKTFKAESIVEYINPIHILRVSATTKINKEAEYIEIDELSVINSGLITKALYINEGVTNEKILINEHDYLLELAIKKRKKIKEEYIKKGIQVNPLVIIQVPNKSNDLIVQIENMLKEKGYSYDRGNLAIWLTERKININDISNNEAHTSILIMKQAISTGWDCPRAKILVKLRDNMKEDFETQIVGRIRRMPQGHHYENIFLDNCYLYTFDEKYKQTIIQELGQNAYDVKVIFLKSQYQNLTLKKIIMDKNLNDFDERETFDILYKYYLTKYNLTTNKIKNKTILETNGYSFKNTIDSHIIQDKINIINSDELDKAHRLNIDIEVSTNKNGLELRNSIDDISKRIGIKYDRTRLMLEIMFLKRKLLSKKFIDLTISEFYAFIINNLDLLKKDFQEAVSQKARQMEIKFEDVKELDWFAPKIDYVKYDSVMKNKGVCEKSIYIDYPNSTLKSNSEREFEKFCETNDNIKWFYKNGQSSSEYFSIFYRDKVRQWNFYPDFIICDKNDKIWIIETKGGETASGNSKNIDMRSENKFEALKEYAETYKLNFGFVRDYDKNNKLYICNSEYTDDMAADNWVLIDEVFI